MATAASEEERLLEFLYAAPVGLIEIAMSGDIALMNPHAMKHLLPLAGARDASNLFAMLESCAPEVRNMLDRFPDARGTVCEGHRIVVELGRTARSHEPKVLACTLVKLDADRAIACLSDISIQVAQERRLKQAEIWFASLINDVREYAVLGVTPGGAIESANLCWEKQTGFTSDAILGRALSEVFPASLDDGGMIMAEQLLVAARDGWHLEESWHYRRDGSRYWSQRLLAARTGEQGDLAGYTLVVRDVMRQAQDTDDLRRLLTQDHLTGAANRARFQQVFERELQSFQDSGAPLSLIMVDIDHFKRVNDRHGHPAGDVVLRRFAETIADALRPADLLARLGGEEFAVLLPATRLEEAVAIAGKLRARVSELVIDTPGGLIQVTASFGCATADGASDPLAAADAALYVAKRSGRDRVEAGAAAIAA